MLNLFWRYILNLVIWFLDEGLNTLRGGDPGETISVAAARNRNAGGRWGCVLCRVLGLLLRTDHCTNALNNWGKHSLWKD